MAYEGWASLAGTEIINNDRVRAYASALIPGMTFTLGSADEVDDSLRKMLDDEPYRTPVLDDAPWIDPDDPDTYDFCGVLGLGVTGLSDALREATVIETNGGGGGITGRRRTTRSIRYSALLVGASQASVEAGMSWLNSALEGDCDGDCNGSDLCVLQALVDPQDWGDTVVDKIALTALTADSGRYVPSTGRWTPSTSTQELRVPNFTLPLPCDEIVWHWKFRGVPGTQVNLISYNEGGKVFSDVVTIDSDGEATRSISDKNAGEKLAYCAIRLLVGSYVDVTSVSVEARDSAKNTACFDHYYRRVIEASPIDGPTVVTQYAPNCGALMKVEFTIASGNPYLFGMFKTISNTTNLTKVGIDQSALAFKLAKTIPVPKAPTAPTWVSDPACPKIPAPPRPQATFSSCGPKPSYYFSYGFSIPGSYIPLWNESVPHLTITTGTKAARGVRVRFYPRPLGDWQDASDIDENSACGQFTIDYIPPSGRFWIEGLQQRCFVRDPSKLNLVPADHLVSGMTGTDLFVWPVLTCGTDYMCVVDIDGEEQSVTEVYLRIATRY